MRNHRPENATDLLSRFFGEKIQPRSSNVEKLKKHLEMELAPELMPHCQIANFRQGILTLECSNASWANYLKMERMNLMSSIRRHVTPYLTTIDIQINPRFACDQVHKNQLATRARHKAKSTITKSAASELLATAEIMPDKIKIRLQAIAARAFDSEKEG